VPGDHPDGSIHFHPRQRLDQGIRPRSEVHFGHSAFVAKVLLWKLHTDSDLANFDHSSTPTLDCYHIARLSQEVETTVLNTVHIIPRATVSTVCDVQQSLATAGGGLTYQVLVNGPNTILEPFMGCDISLDQARIVATLIAHQRMGDYNDAFVPAVMDKTVISLLKSSSDHWDHLLGVLMSMRTAGHPTAGDLADLTLFARGPEGITLSQISTILNSIRVHLEPWENRHSLVASVRIGSAILQCYNLSILELAFIIAHFISFTKAHRLFGIDKLEKMGFRPALRDGKIFFPYLYDDAVLLDLFDLLSSFPSLIHKLAKHCMHPNASGAFAILFLIRLHHASPMMYWRVMGQLSYGEVREWAREVPEELMHATADVILNSQGIGTSGSILPDEQIQQYDQSLDPKAVDLDRPMVHAIHEAAKWQDRPIVALANVWLAIHAQTAYYGNQLPIPMEHIQWVDHPIPEMIALKRLSSSGFRVQAETAFINLCLHSTSFAVLLPALKHHLEWLHGLSGDGHVPDVLSDGTSWNEMLNVLSNAFRVLLRSDLAPNQLSSFWGLVYRLCDTQWAGLPDSWHLNFLQCFFTLIDQGAAITATTGALPVVSMPNEVSLLDGVGGFTDSHSLINEPPSLKPGYLGIKWLETLWKKVLKPRSRTVMIGSVAFPWLGVEGGEWDHRNEVVFREWVARENAEEQVGEQGLDQSVTKVLQTLAKLLEAARIRGLVTVDLADAISTSLLLADDQLQQDQISLDCIEAIIDPLRVPLPSTPPPRVISFSCHMEHP
jgi:hypothetical protein